MRTSSRKGMIVYTKYAMFIKDWLSNSGFFSIKYLYVYNIHDIYKLFST